MFWLIQVDKFYVNIPVWNHWLLETLNTGGNGGFYWKSWSKGTTCEELPLRYTHCWGFFMWVIGPCITLETLMSERMWWLPRNDAAASSEKCLPYDSCAAGRGVQHIFIIKVMNLIANWQPNGNCRPWYWEKIAYKATPERAGFKFIHPFRHWGEHRNCRVFCLACLVQMDDTSVFLYLRTRYSVMLLFFSFFFFNKNKWPCCLNFT